MSKKTKTLLFFISILMLVIPFLSKPVQALTDNSSITKLTLTRINEIRSTKNTDVSKIKGKIYYVSDSGSDDNDGLTINTPIKTVTKLNSLMNSKTIKNGDAVLFKRGDTFRGEAISIKDNNITFGSYGDEKLPKPKIYGSAYNAKEKYVWKEVYPNIWKYTKNGTDSLIFKYDVGGIWFFCNDKNNKNCTRITTDGKTKYSFGFKKMSYNNVEETEGLIKSILTKDLDFYHTGHAYSGTTNGGELYLYSTSDPTTRFDDIEISLGKNGIGVSSYNNIVIDNLDIKFFSRHGVGAGSIANLKVTNCEFSYIGGTVQHYDADGHWPVRFGNAIEVYGNVADTTNYKVEEGFIAKNNYIYEIYDAGLTFQYTAKEGKSAIVERVVFDNNVVENCSYDIEYWNQTQEVNDSGIIYKSYINKVYFTNNILRYAGIGFTETRPEHGYEALIKSWDGSTPTHNVLKEDGEFIIEKNIFDTTGTLNDNKGNPVGTWMLHITAADEASMPIIRNNKFYNYKTKNLGYVYTQDTRKVLIPYSDRLKYNETLLKNNEFVVFDADPEPTGIYSGKSNQVDWQMNLNTRTLTISGTGKMADYTSSDLAPWSKYSDYINTIIIGENVTYLGKYAFYNSYYAQNLVINSKQLSNLSTNNNTLYNLGKYTTGTKLVIGENVEVLPAYLTNPAYSQSTSPFIRFIEFKGNKLKTINNSALSYTFISDLVVPESVETINNGAFQLNKTMKIIVFPSKVTSLSQNVLKNNTNLETVILGKNMVSAEANSMTGLTNLNCIVIPNTNFNISTDVTIIDKVSKFGVQVYGPSQLEAVVNSFKNEGQIVYYIPMNLYRPIIYGDSKNYYAIHDELHYGDSGNYEALALENADVAITTGKYRYIDRFKHKHLMAGLNIDVTNKKVSNVVMDVELVGSLKNIKTNSLENQTILFLGNSYTTGFGSQGMAASDVKYDYYHYVTTYLKNMNSNIKTYRVSINPWEENTSADDRLVKLEDIITNFNKNIQNKSDVRTVFIQLSENVSNAERRATFENDFDILVIRFKTEYPNAKIYIAYNNKTSKTNKTMITNVATSNNLETITYWKSTALNDRYRSYMGAKYQKWDRKISYVDNEGISCHPGNYGFIDIANDIITYLKTTNYAKIVSLTSNKYNIENKQIYITPTTLDYNKNELSNNLSVSVGYEIYDNKNQKVTTNTNIGTGYKLKVGNDTYNIVVLGDVTGDGKISLGDIAKLYNHYKNNSVLTGSYLEAGKVNKSSKIALGDIAKLYNFYKGKLSSL